MLTNGKEQKKIEGAASDSSDGSPSPLVCYEKFERKLKLHSFVGVLTKHDLINIEKRKHRNYSSVSIL